MKDQLSFSLNFLTLIVLSIILFISCSCLRKESKTFDEMATQMASKFSSPVISFKEFMKIQKDSEIVILDARELSEYLVSHIKNARHVGYDDFNLEKVLSSIDKNMKVIVYCSVGYRSGDIAQRLRVAGYDSYNLYGGLFGWVNKQGSVFSESGQTNRVHGFSPKWGKWLARGEIVYK